MRGQAGGRGRGPGALSHLRLSLCLGHPFQVFPGSLGGRLLQEALPSPPQHLTLPGCLSESPSPPPRVWGFPKRTLRPGLPWNLLADSPSPGLWPPSLPLDAQQGCGVASAPQGLEQGQAHSRSPRRGGVTASSTAMGSERSYVCPALSECQALAGGCPDHSGIEGTVASGALGVAPT